MEFRLVRSMKVSVVVPTYSLDRYDDFCECVEAVFEQTYDDIEVVIVVDGNEAVYEKACADFGDRTDTTIFFSKPNAGPISRANMGGVLASGDVIALTDDDAVPSADWIERLVAAYQAQDAVAVGGRMVPDWVAGKPDFLPEEFYWLIGVTHEGFQEKPGEVRNTFGANLSYKREAFMKLGGLKLAGFGPSQIQGRETEFCARLREAYGQGVWYDPEAIVAHKIYEYRTNQRWLAKRAFWQGVSKRGMEKFVPDAGGRESDFLRYLIGTSIPRRLSHSLTSLAQAKQLFWLILLMWLVGMGYLYGILKYR